MSEDSGGARPGLGRKGIYYGINMYLFQKMRINGIKGVNSQISARECL
jgi:hypothetical protein